MAGLLKVVLVNAATNFDRKQSTKKGYNPYALPQYIQRIQETCQEVDAGTPAVQAVTEGFSGRLQTAMLKALDKMTGPA